MLNRLRPSFPLFFFNDTATTEIYTLSLHDALPIWVELGSSQVGEHLLPYWPGQPCHGQYGRRCSDRKSTRLNSSHQIISYAVFCLKKKNNMRSNYRKLQVHSKSETLAHTLRDRLIN